jgi:hypothetical protein
MTPIEQAQEALRMTPQERALYERHLANLRGAGKVTHPDGSISTLYQMNVQGPDGQHYNIPSVYNGAILPPEQAIRNAEQQGWHNFPGYPNPETAESRYGQMHGYMDQDVGAYLSQARPRSAGPTRNAFTRRLEGQ